MTVQLRQQEVQQAATKDERNRASSELSERSLQATQLEAELQTKTHEVTQLQAQLSSSHQVGGLDFLGWVISRQSHGCSCSPGSAV